MLIFHDPDAVFVLKNAIIGARHHAAVATGGTAGAGPRIFAGVGRIRGSRRIRSSKKKSAEPNHGASQRQSLGLSPDSHSSARMQPALFARAVKPVRVRIFILPVRIEVNPS